VSDGRIQGLEWRGIDSSEVAAAIAVEGEPSRTMEFTGVRETDPQQLGQGSVVITRHRDPSANRVTARLAPGDAWPENDSMELVPPPRAALARWWVALPGASPGASPTIPQPDGWRRIAPSELSAQSLDYLAPSIIVLEKRRRG
jgi:hypothetical protein